MKFKLLVGLVEKLLGAGGDKPRGDMYLPVKVLSLGLVLLLGGGAGIVYCVLKQSWLWGVAAGAMVLLGIVAILCWRNQKIVLLDEDHFEYCTFLGNRKRYAFTDITGLRENSDSMTLYVTGGKIHMESSAIISDALAEKINAALAKIYGEDEPQA